MPFKPATVSGRILVMRRYAAVLVLFTLLVLLPISTGAKGVFSAVLLKDPVTGTILDVTRGADVLEQFFIFDFERGEVEAPEITTTGYEVQRGSFVNERFVPFDLLIYYLEAPNYIYYAGLLNAEGELCGLCSEYDDRWYLLTSEAKTAFQGLINQRSQQSSFRPITATSGSPLLPRIHARISRVNLASAPLSD
jgi:hypothetical protein